MSRGRPALAPLDLALALLFVFMVLALDVINRKPPSVTTFGQYAVTVTWPGDRGDDIDTYVRDPQGDTVWYGAAQVDAMQLEHDDLGTTISGYGYGRPNTERVVIRQSTAGEYVANVQYYAATDKGAVPVTVELWDLRGNDKLLLTRRVSVSWPGDERTAFRFRLNQRGEYAGSSTLPVSLLPGHS